MSHQMTPAEWQAKTNTDRLKRVQRKGYKAYRCLNGTEKGNIVKFRLEGNRYVFDSIELGLEEAPATRTEEVAQ